MKLPQPSPEALAQSGQLVDRLRSLIEAQGGWISFATYMAEALYTPGLGYYSGGAHKFGPGGDFITAPELTPLFGQALASQVQQIMDLSAPQVIEAGAGTGLLAADLLLELERRGALPERYAILDLSGELRERQRKTIEQRVPHLLSRVVWLDRLPEHFDGKWNVTLEYVGNPMFKPWGSTPGHWLEWARLILQLWVLGQHGGGVACSTQRAVHVPPHCQALKGRQHLSQQHRHVRLVGGGACLGWRCAGVCRSGSGPGPAVQPLEGLVQQDSRTVGQHGARTRAQVH